MDQIYIGTRKQYNIYKCIYIYICDSVCLLKVYMHIYIYSTFISTLCVFLMSMYIEYISSTKFFWLQGFINFFFVNSLRLKSRVAPKWASKQLWGYHLFCWRLFIRCSLFQWHQATLVFPLDCFVDLNYNNNSIYNYNIIIYYNIII